MTEEIKKPEENKQAGIKNITPDFGVTQQPTPQPKEKEVEDANVVFVPFEDFTGRINQTDFNFRKDIPTKVPKSQANVWIESKKGYLK